MKRGMWLLPLLWVAGPTGSAQERIGNVSLQVVKYAGLSEAVAKNRGKVVLVDFWSTTCPPCMKNFPHVVKLHQRWAREGLAVISVSLDRLEDGEKTLARVHGFLKRQGADFTNLLLDDDPAIFDKRLRINTIPCYYVFNRAGKWTKFGGGLEEAPDLEAMDRLIEQLLRER